MTTAPSTSPIVRNITARVRTTPTWMAGHAKIVAVYPQPFWRHDGLNGDAVSHRGPLAEVHDASPPDGSVGALFGFVAVPASQQRDSGALLTAATEQLASLFGSAARSPTKVLLQDWAAEDLTATPDDTAPLTRHPAYGPIDSLEDLWGGRLHIASSETAPTYGGYLEGALEAAEIAAAKVIAP